MKLQIKNSHLIALLTFSFLLSAPSKQALAKETSPKLLQPQLVKVILEKSRGYSEKAHDYILEGQVTILKAELLNDADMMLKGSKLLIKGLYMRNKALKGLQTQQSQIKLMSHSNQLAQHPFQKQNSNYLKTELQQLESYLQSYRDLVHKERIPILKRVNSVLLMGKSFLKKARIDGKNKEDLLKQGQTLMQAGQLLQQLNFQSSQAFNRRIHQQTNMGLKKQIKPESK